MVKAGYIGGSKDPLTRKLNYERDLASTEGIDLSMLRWGAILNNILSSISFNVLFNFILNLYLSLNLYFEPSQFDFNMPDFFDSFNITIEKVGKAKYGISKYGQSVYDPPLLTYKDLARALWSLRYQTTCENALAYKHIGKTVSNWIETVKKQLLEKGLSESYFDGMVGLLSLVEGKILTTAYFDFAAFDVNVFSYEVDGKNVIIARNTENWKTGNILETIGVYECHFDHSEFDYARFIENYGREGIKVKKEACDNLLEKIKDFHARSGQFKEYGVKGLFQRVFFLERKDRLKWQGGKHQVYLQRVINEVKRICNKYGIIAQVRGAYIAFAQELFYRGYVPHRRYKRWKQVLTDNDIVNKYINMGCDKQVLNEIKGVVVKWRPKT